MTLKQALEIAVNRLDNMGIDLPPDVCKDASAAGLTIKGRDPREPGRRRKTSAEQKLKNVLARRFRKKLAKLRTALESR